MTDQISYRDTVLKLVITEKRDSFYSDYFNNMHNKLTPSTFTEKWFPFNLK
uniref:Uncharacterized protein n=1 Tax=Arundo donax TaxID=35708 RepID=A0A0A9BKC0_ARUDO